MTAKRPLPKKNNPLITPEESPDYEELLSRRRLGKTNLAVKPGQVGTSNATKPENLGLFEYAHLRAPIPKDLKGSEIFSHAAQQTANTYFLMRRSRDGFISATGMFKIAFPWAKSAEEKREREYLKSREATSEDEIAGNVWISPGFALELAADYQMLDWVRALLDPRDITQNLRTPEKNISPPPRFELPSTDGNPVETPSSNSRARTRRSASPSKSTAPSGRKILQPRKPRGTRAQKDSDTPSSSAANESLQNTLDAVAADPSANGEVEDTAEVNGEAEVQKKESGGKKKHSKKTSDNAKVNVETTVDATADVETSKTNVSVDMPPGAEELSLPQDPDAMISKAKEMVEEASKMQNESTSKITQKRKAGEDSEDDAGAASSTQPTKRAKVLENTLRRERVRNRALIGVTATAALAATIPYFF